MLCGAQVVPTLDTTLPAWWNAYDGFNTWRTYGVGDPQPLLDNATWTATQQLAFWLETAKSKSPLAKNLLGEGLQSAGGVAGAHHACSPHALVSSPPSPPVACALQAGRCWPTWWST